MLDANAEIDRLRHDLLYEEIPSWKVDKICDQAASEIGNRITDHISEAMDTAASHGLKMGADDFVNQLTISRVGHSFRVDTLSRKTDFSEPPFPMLPKLLKNAKTAKDGSQYKVIPVGGGTMSKPRLDYFSIAKEINDSRRAAKEARESDRESPTRQPERFISSVDLMSVQKQTKIKDVIKTPEFRTASSKQNPDKQWVRPAKEMDMTRILMGINADLEYSIDESIRDVIERYRKEFTWRT